MKQYYLLGFLLFVSQIVNGQILPDPDSAHASNSHFYYENKGQIIDDSGYHRPEIKYYTEQASPSVYLANDKISFVTHHKSTDSTIPDTSFRIDMQLWCPAAEMYQPCGNIQTYEQSHDYLNYYLPQDTNGIEDVPGYARIVYQNAFHATDAHFYSDDVGIRTYFVFKPTADTANFRLKFTGQDSIAVVANALEMYVGPQGMIFPEAKAYQVDASGMIVSLPWLPVWKYSGGDIVTMGFGPYNPSMDLVVSIGQGRLKATAGTDNLVWTTFYGDFANEANPISAYPSDGHPVIKSNADGSLVFHAMGSNSVNFPLKAGSSGFLTQSRLEGDFDCILSAFDGNGVRQWATYYGGTNYEEPTALELLPPDQTFGNLLLAGRTRSSSIQQPVSAATTGWKKTANLPTGTTYKETGSFLAGFGASNGHYYYFTFFGAGAYCYINDLSYDATKEEILFCGFVQTHGLNQWSTIVETSSSTPSSTQLSLRNISGRYYQNTDETTKSGFVGAFSFKSSDIRSLKWCTLLGGNGSDFLNSIVYDKSQGHDGIYVLGNTSSSVPSGATFGSSPLTSLPSSGALPLVQPSTGSPYFQTNMQGQHGLLVHFNSNRAIDWSSYFGASGTEEYTGLAVNATGETYIAGVTQGGNPSQTNLPIHNTLNRVPVYKLPGSNAYSQGPGNTSITSGNNHTDAIIARFDASHKLKWCTYFGQKGVEFNPTRIAIDDANNVYVSGGNEADTDPSASLPQGIPTVALNGRYNQSDNSSMPGIVSVNGTPEAEDGWIAHFGADNSLKWSTHYGGLFPGTWHPIGDVYDSRERITSIDVGVKNGKTSLYMTGATRNPKTPIDFSNSTPRCIVCAPSTLPLSFRKPYSNGWDAFIGKFEDARSTSISSLNSLNGNAIRVSPNPSHDRFNIHFVNSNNAIANVPLSVTNSIGQVVISQQVNVTHGQNSFTMSLEGLPSGIYILHLKIGEYSSAVKISKY